MDIVKTTITTPYTNTHHTHPKHTQTQQTVWNRGEAKTKANVKAKRCKKQSNIQQFFSFEFFVFFFRNILHK